MSPEAELRLRVAERFHVDAGWESRLSLGWARRASDGRLLPGDDWRPPTTDELARLLARTDGGGAAAGDAASPARADERHADAAFVDVALASLPRHLRRAFWDAVDRAALDPDAAGEPPPGAPPPALAAFASALIEFLRFKQAALPEPAACAIVVAREGTRSTRGAADGASLRGLEFDRETSGEGRLRLAANLGDEPTHLVLLARGALSPACAGADPPGAGTPETALDGDALRALRARLAEPSGEARVLRVRLEPGEALLLPAADVAHDGWTVGQAEPQILAVVRETGEAGRAGRALPTRKESAALRAAPTGGAAGRGKPG